MEITGRTYTAAIPEASDIKLTVTAEEVGEDLLLIVRGGKAHIGTAVLSEPRASLTGDGSTSCTSSVLNVTGHKDEEICRYLAERVCSATGRRTLCTGGVHIDHISPDEIHEIQSAVKDLAGRILRDPGF